MACNWHYEGQPLLEPPEGAVGFVYLIENITNGRRYVGKKQFWSTRRLPPLKGKTRKRTVIKESDWRSYTGSSLALNEDIAAGHDIHKTVLHIAYSKGMTSYLELVEQVNRNVLTDDRYYNGIIQAKIHASHIK